MNRFTVTLSLLFVLAAVPLAAQDRTADLTLWASQVDVQGSNTVADSFETDFESGDGFGVSFNVFLTPRISAEVSAFKVSSDATLLFGDIPFSMGSAGMTPITAGVQYHFAGQSRIDPYVGAGAAYVLGGKLKSTDLDSLGTGTIQLDDEFTYYANAGIGVRLFRGISLVVDGRYLPYEPNTVASKTGGEEELDLTSLILSAGLRFRF